MSCCEGTTPSGDCSAALTQLVRLCQKWYGTPQALDTVDGQELARVLESYGVEINNLKYALSQIMGTDCKLVDDLVLCRNLAYEVGRACLVDGQITPVPPPPPGPVPGGPVLDYPLLGNAYGGWGLRRLLTAYTGPAIRVRRALDNAEQDIGFAANGLIDTAALETFAQGSDCFVTTIYDQQVQGPFNLLQATPAKQPKIYDNVSGFVLNGEGRLAMYFDSIDDTMHTDLGSLMRHTTQMLTAVALERHDDGNGYEWEIDTSVPGGTGSGPRLQWKRPTSTSQYWQGTVGGNGANSNTHYQDLNKPMLPVLAALEDGTPIHTRMRVNGSTEGSDPTGGFIQNGQGQMWIGSNSDASNYSGILVSEIVYYDDIDWAQLIPDLAENVLQVLEDNMMATWGVTPS